MVLPIKKKGVYMVSNIGFEYQDIQKETVFETFLKYSDEKERSAKVLGVILRELLTKDGMTLLDIGSGNGEYLRLALDRLKSLSMSKLTLMEPSDNLINRLRLTIKRFPPNLRIKVIQSTFENFSTKGQFDIVLVSHLPFSKIKLPDVFRKMLKLLRPGGNLIVVLRKKDDIHEFRSKFKSQLMRRKYRSLTIEDAIGVFIKLAKDKHLKISTFKAEAELHIPLADNVPDAISIIEFLLNRRWIDFPYNIQKAVLNYIYRKRGVLHQTDGFALVNKPGLSYKSVHK
jgi:SAM-dependent methyltransferase